MTLIRVQGDREVVRVKRRGRFAIERAAASSPQHFLAAVKEMQEQMIAGLAKKGFRYVGEDFELRGPLEHYDYSESIDADPGPKAMPDPRDAAAFERWQRAERARTARKAGQAVELVDYQLVTAFDRALPQALRTLPHSLAPATANPRALRERVAA